MFNQNCNRKEQVTELLLSESVYCLLSRRVLLTALLLVTAHARLFSAPLTTQAAQKHENSKIEIIAPANKATITSLPVMLKVRFGPDTDASEMQTLLDGADITSLFSAADANGIRQAQVNRPAVKLGKNELRVSVKGDVARASFLVSDGLPGSSSGFPQLVTIETRIVTGDGTEASDYSVRVGSKTYPAPPLAFGAAGFHVVRLSRSTLAMIWNRSYDLSQQGMQSMWSDIEGSGPDLIVLSSMNVSGESDTDPQGTATGLSLLGGTLSYFENPDTSILAGAYSLIGNVGLPQGSAVELSSLINVNPTTNGNIQGDLIPDIHENYTFFYSQLVQIQTNAGPNKDTVIIKPMDPTGLKGTTIVAPPLPDGASGGYHIVILAREALDQVAANPSAVLLNQSYATNSAQGPSEAARMAQDLAGYNTGIFFQPSVVVIIASLGISGFSQPIDYGSVAYIESVIKQIGGTYSSVNPDGRSWEIGNLYAIIGSPGWSGQTAPEFRSWADSYNCSSVSPTPCPNITAVLQRNNQSIFTPIGADRVGDVDYSLLQIALQTPSAWPIANNGSDTTCPENDQQCAAYHWISHRVLCGTDSQCSDTDIRSTYYDTLEDPVALKNDVTNLSYMSGNGFTEDVFFDVQQQLEKELGYVDLVQHMLTSTNAAIQNFAIGSGNNLTTAFTNVERSVQTPPSSNTLFDVLGVVRTMTMIGAALDPDPISKSTLGVMSGVLYLNMSFNRTPNGAPNTTILGVESELSSQLVTQFNDALGTNGELFKIILTDWDKLSTVGKNIKQEAAGWVWDTTTPAALLDDMQDSFIVSLYQALVPATYHVVYFNGVSFKNPSDYGIPGDCWKGYCECNTGFYNPPSWAYEAYPTGNVNMLATPNNDYPSSGLMQQTLSGVGVYLPDLFNGLRGWQGIQFVLPEDWPGCNNQ